MARQRRGSTESRRRCRATSVMQEELIRLWLISHVLHLAALLAIPFSYNSPDAYVQTNVTGTLNAAGRTPTQHRAFGVYLYVRDLWHSSARAHRRDPPQCATPRRHQSGGRSIGVVISQIFRNACLGSAAFQHTVRGSLLGR